MKPTLRILGLVVLSLGLALGVLIFRTRPDDLEIRGIQAVFTSARQASVARDTNKLRELSLFTKNLTDEQVAAFFDFLKSTATDTLEISKDGPVYYWVRPGVYPVSFRLVRTEGQFLFQGDVLTHQD